MVDVNVIVLCKSFRQFLFRVRTADSPSAYFDEHKVHVVEKAAVQSINHLLEGSIYFG